MTKLRVAAALSTLALLSACAVGPDYRPLPIDAPAHWQATDAASSSALAGSASVDDAADLAHWWTWFDDASLNSLITTALAQNLDVRAAQARIHAARGAGRS